MRKNFFTGRVQALEQGAQESVAVTIPQGVKKMSICGTARYCLVGMVAFS